MRWQAGLAFIELIIVLGMLATLLTLATVNLLGVRSATALTNATNTIMTDVRAQQQKSMLGQTSEGDSPSAFGVYFEASRYVLFAGASYNPNDPVNSPVSLTSDLRLSVTLPENSLIFSRGSGEILGFSETNDNITVTAVDSGEERTLEFNRYGVPISLQ